MDCPRHQGPFPGATLHYILTLAGFALSIWGFLEIGCPPGTGGSNSHGPDPLLRATQANRLTRR
jgi:uncharacterized membrane protein YhaH (DUF805 family)